MAYIEPKDFTKGMVDAGESKIFMSTKDTFIRAFMAGAILGLAAFFAITVIVKTGSPLVWGYPLSGWLYHVIFNEV